MIEVVTDRFVDHPDRDEGFMVPVAVESECVKSPMRCWDLDAHVIERRYNTFGEAYYLRRRRGDDGSCLPRLAAGEFVNRHGLINNIYFRHLDLEES